MMYMEELAELLLCEDSTYDKLRSTFSECASRELLAEQLNEAKDRLKVLDLKKAKRLSKLNYKGRVGESYHGV